MLVLEKYEKIVTYLESSIFENRNHLRPANNEGSGLQEQNQGWMCFSLSLKRILFVVHEDMIWLRPNVSGWYLVMPMKYPMVG